MIAGIMYVVTMVRKENAMTVFKNAHHKIVGTLTKNHAPSDICNPFDCT